MRPLPSRGFTLVEVLVVAAMIAVLAAIALPNYSDHVLRSRLIDATNELSAMRARMEQYYLDNRTYATTGSYSPPCLTTSTVGVFTVSCAAVDVSAAGYKITAQGSDIAANFTYTIDQSGTKRTLGTKWGTTSNTCWLTKRGEVC